MGYFWYLIWYWNETSGGRQTAVYSLKNRVPVAQNMESEWHWTAGILIGGFFCMLIACPGELIEAFMVQYCVLSDLWPIFWIPYAVNMERLYITFSSCSLILKDKKNSGWCIFLHPLETHSVLPCFLLKKLLVISHVPLWPHPRIYVGLNYNDRYRAGWEDNREIKPYISIICPSRGKKILKWESCCSVT